MSKKVSVEKALEYNPFTPDRKRRKTEGSPPPTTSKPEDIMEVDLPTPDARKMAFEASAEDRKPRGGRKSRRRSKKVRKTRRKSRK